MSEERLPMQQKIINIVIVLIAVVALIFFVVKKRERATLLKNFHRVTQHDPLFYSPLTDEGFDMKKYRKLEERIFSGTYLYEYFREQDLQMNLIPHDYLESLKDNILATDRFLKSPSIPKAEDLLYSYEHVVEQYLKNINDLGIILNMIIQNNTGDIMTCTDFGRVIHLETVINDLKLIAQNGGALQKEIKKRWRILKGEEKFFFPDPVLPDLDDMQGIPRKKFLSRAKAYDILWEYFLQEWESINHEPYFSKETLMGVEIKGPYAINIDCSLESPEHLVYAYFSQESFPLMYPNHFLADGITYICDDYPECTPDNLLAVCSCPYIEKDKVNWYLIDYMKTQLEEEPLYGSGERKISRNFDAIVSQGRFLEEEFLEYPSQQTLSFLGKNYETLYLEMEKSGKIPKAFRNKRERIWKYYQLIQSKISFIPHVFDKYDFDLDERTATHLLEPLSYADQFPLVQIESENDQMNFDFALLWELTMLVLEESHYSLFYMPWAKSVWRIDEKLQYYNDDSRFKNCHQPLYKYEPLR